MFEVDSITKQFTNMMSEGFIFIDNKGIIRLYNNNAKKIFGINNVDLFSHGAGRIEKGDIVIIGDNSIGRDDGRLTSESFKRIGIDDKNIEAGDSIIAAGIFDDTNELLPVYKHLKSCEDCDSIEIKCMYENVRIYAQIDFKNKKIAIGVNSDVFVINYRNSFGHMVVLDKKTKKVKFYQTFGYTARSEAISDLLKGESFRSKGTNSERFEVVGRNIFEIHGGNSTAHEFFQAASGENIYYENQFKEINGIPTICSLYPVNHNDVRIGAVLKIEDISEVEKIIRERDEALEKLAYMEKKLNEEEEIKGLFPEFIGDSKEINNVKKLAVKASKTNSTVLILGESGTGKSLLAKEIHNNSRNKDKPFISVNCGSITETLLESELFGYDGGAFTGAKEGGKIGMFELAHGGTIFLDEIGEISPYLQVKLLQVLQDKSFYRVGGNKKIEVDIRIIVATNKNLEVEMINGRFREDLYYRINVFPIWIPPLRERKQDIVTLVKSLLPDICKRLGCEEKSISREALELLMAYSWPGNVRELENMIERAVNLVDGHVILSKHLPNKKIRDNVFEIQEISTLKTVIDEAEKKAIKKVILHFKGDRKAAMEALDISKSSFYDKLKKYNLENMYSGK